MFQYRTPLACLQLGSCVLWCGSTSCGGAASSRRTASVASERALWCRQALVFDVLLFIVLCGSVVPLLCQGIRATGTQPHGSLPPCIYSSGNATVGKSRWLISQRVLRNGVSNQRCPTDARRSTKCALPVGARMHQLHRSRTLLTMDARAIASHPACGQ